MEENHDKVKTLIAKAPVGWTAKKVILNLSLDQYQTRLSNYPIMLRNPKTGQSKVLSEYVDEILGDSRFAIETEDALVFISRVKNSSMGSVFIPTYVMPRAEWKTGNLQEVGKQPLILKG